MKKAVLIVDDDPAWRQLLGDLVEEEYKVTLAATYNEALNALQKQEPPFHVVVTDIQLGQGGTNEEGLSLVAELNRMDKFTKAIVITGQHTSKRVKKSYRDLKARDYLKKDAPFDEEAFCNTVHEAVEEAEKEREFFAFVLMPFAEQYEPMYLEIIKKTVEEAGLISKRADDFFQSRRIMVDIQKSIQEAKFVIGDFSGKNVNVFFEVGLAHGMGKPVILLTQSLEDVPPKLQGVRCIQYEDNMGGGLQLKERLTRAIKALQEVDYHFEPIFKSEAMEIDPKLCFVLTPDSTGTTYRNIIEKTVLEKGLHCLNPNNIFSFGDVMDKIWANLHKAHIVIVDMSGKDADVFYLAGASQGLNKQVILMTQNLADIPSDLRGAAPVVYSTQTREDELEASRKLSNMLEISMRNKERASPLSGISSDIYNRLQELLPRLDPFNSNQSLEDIFVAEAIHIWQNNLPQADNRGARVNTMINYLHNKYDASGKSALQLFLQELYRQIPSGDSRKQELANLIAELEKVI